MKRFFRSLILVAIIWPAAALPLHAFSRQAHQAIADLAYDSPALKPSARAAIKKILGRETVADAAEWPDAIKPPHGALSTTNKAKAFIRAHPNHHLWHFVDFPVGSTAYDPDARYALDTDIVHALHGCIAVLEGADRFDHLTKKDALRYLIHLVGDIHQPLHTVSGYYDIHDPAHPLLYPPGRVPVGAFRDVGGNDLYYTKSEELHADWDDDLVASITGNKDTVALVDAMATAFSPSGSATAGDYHRWPEAWASDTMQAGAAAYYGIQFNNYALVQNRTTPTPEISITLPAGYKASGREIEKQQILKAAEHLFQLFNAIQWKE